MKKRYEVLQRVWRSGVAVEPGSVVSMTDLEAKYLKSNGSIKEYVGLEVEPPSSVLEQQLAAADPMPVGLDPELARLSMPMSRRDRRSKKRMIHGLE
jgi:hypothetical protein